MMPGSFDVLGVRISAVNLKTALDQIEEWIANRVKTYICVAPVSTIMDCQDDKQYHKVIDGASMVTPDGMPLVWLANRRGLKFVGRTYGPDLLNAFCALSEDKGYRHFFYGGSALTNRLLVENLRKRFPKLLVAGEYAPAFLACGQKEKTSVIEQINSSGADILWVGLGSPKQDFWMAGHRSKVNVPVMIGVGAAFDFLAGTKRQAPGWIQKAGLEWLFRLCCEPLRLWRRYLLGNVRFLYLLVTKNLFCKSEDMADSI